MLLSSQYVPCPEGMEVSHCGLAWGHTVEPTFELESDSSAVPRPLPLIY